MMLRHDKAGVQPPPSDFDSAVLPVLAGGRSRAIDRRDETVGDVA